MLHKPALLVALGVLLALVANNTLAGFLNPILAPAKLSYT